ncbi:MAG: hypothetical protein HY910_07845 [Desulfarculus sp.]|nr:hypothetical protein [Desulfarculus sp.]
MPAKAHNPASPGSRLGGPVWAILRHGASALLILLLAVGLFLLCDTLLRLALLPAPGAGPGLLAQRYGDARLGGQPGPAYVETRVAMSDAVDADFRAGNFSLRLTGTLSVTLPGPYLLGVESDDDSRLFVDGRKLVDNSGAHPLRLRAAWVWLGPGRHLIEVEYAQRENQAALNLLWRPWHGLGLSHVPLARLRPSPSPLARDDAQALGERLFSAATPCLGLAMWLLLALMAGRWLPQPRRPWWWAAASLVMIAGMWLCSGTMSIYAANSAGGAPHGPCQYAVNLDHQHFEATFWMLDGDPPEKWGFSLVLRRILYPLLAYPFMAARGVMEGGFLANVLLSVLALYSWAVFLERRVGRRGGLWGTWLLALYPGLAYWGGLPYSYAIIVPASLWGFMLLYRLDQARNLAGVLWPCLGLGALALGYDLLPFFAPAALGLTWWRTRRLAWCGLGLAALAAPTVLLLLLLEALGVPASSQNAAQPLAILLSYLHPGELAAWGRLLMQVPEILLNNLLAGNFYVLPLLFLALLALNLRRGGVRLQAPETALLLGLLLVFLFNNLAPPHGFPTFRGVHVARFYQPACAVLIYYAARVMQQGQGRPLLAVLCALALMANGLLVAGPALGLSTASEVYWRFYRHAPRADYLDRFLERHGRRPMGVCGPVRPEAPGPRTPALSPGGGEGASASKSAGP